MFRRMRPLALPAFQRFAQAFLSLRRLLLRLKLLHAFPRMPQGHRGESTRPEPHTQRGLLSLQGRT